MVDIEEFDALIGRRIAASLALLDEHGFDKDRIVEHIDALGAFDITYSWECIGGACFGSYADARTELGITSEEGRELYAFDGPQPRDMPDVERRLYFTMLQNAWEVALDIVGRYPFAPSEEAFA